MSRRVNTTHELIWSRIAVGRCSLRNTGCTNMVPGAPIESEIHTLWGRPGLSLHTRLVCGSPRQKSPPIPPKKPLFRVQCLISRPPRARPRFSFFFLSRFYRDFLAKRAPNKNLHNRPPFNRPPHSLAPGETLINEIHLARRWKGLLSAPSSSPSKRNCFPFTAPFFFFSPISWTSFFEWRPIINDTWPNLTKRKGKGYTFFSFLFSFSHTKSKSRFFFERRKSVVFVYVTSIIVSSRCYHVISDKGWK